MKSGRQSWEAFPGSVDQHILNAVCFGHTGFLPLKWNVCLSDVPFLHSGQMSCFYATKEAEDAVNNPALLHYTGKYKPWNCAEILLSHEWFRYFLKTPFSDIELHRSALNHGYVPKEEFFSVLGIPVLRKQILQTKIKYYLFGLKVGMKKFSSKGKPAKK